ncbi:chlorophyll synthesis pathway protein BchC [Oceaniglobus roseus]|uniref:chlorophyll synthesis pathway protein BchC n=1 Tax=Oceaniglobus roseus TaxID=1737570 RepID=UPI000C7EB194|nr:chlorophyll synthesis pathway protein BchC [Kandeliimicrobium roseum]
MHTTAVIMTAPGDIGLADVALNPPGPGDLVIEVSHSGISTGTEKLFWNGRMPRFPGMGYPLVPGYEATGEVVEAPAGSAFRLGQRVFVPGADCFGGVRGLFGGASRRLVTPAERVVRIDPAHKAEGALLALAATALHAMSGKVDTLPELIVGHGVVGRLLARLTMALGAPAPVVWEIDPARRHGATGYDVISPEAESRRGYGAIYDASGQASVIPELIGRLTKGGEIVLAGFYADPISFAFPPAFMKEARLRVAAEWTRADLERTRDLVESGALSLDGLISHTAPAGQAPAAYATAFDDSACLKMILDWKGQP